METLHIPAPDNLWLFIISAVISIFAVIFILNDDGGFSAVVGLALSFIPYKLMKFAWYLVGCITAHPAWKWTYDVLEKPGTHPWLFLPVFGGIVFSFMALVWLVMWAFGIQRNDRIIEVYPVQPPPPPPIRPIPEPPQEPIWVPEPVPEAQQVVWHLPEIEPVQFNGGGCDLDLCDGQDQFRFSDPIPMNPNLRKR